MEKVEVSGGITAELSFGWWATIFICVVFVCCVISDAANRIENAIAGIQPVERKERP